MFSVCMPQDPRVRELVPLASQDRHQRSGPHLDFRPIENGFTGAAVAGIRVPENSSGGFQLSIRLAFTGVENGIAYLAHGSERSRLSQEKNHPLIEPAGNRRRFCKILCVKRRPQIRREE